ncbi:hypothetical protein [Litorivita sp. NS0012-18]|uniref:hypothetical protein n=1 Tax=Litorivita sp. NS0012-18 TaxID=3127655 RepID=UPI0031081647
MKHITYAVAVLVAAMFWGVSVSAATLVSVSGGGTGGFAAGPIGVGTTGDQYYSALTISFTLDADYTGVSIDADVFCSNCTGNAYLTTDLGPGTGVGDLTQIDAFSGTYGSITGLTTIFSGLSLSADTYYVTIAVTDSILSWGSGSPTTFGGTGGTAGLIDLGAENLDGLRDYDSSFVSLQNTDNRLVYTVSGDGVITPPPTPVVPAPPALALALTGFVGFGFLRRRKRQT